jgi:hypothetical protein
VTSQFRAFVAKILGCIVAGHKIVTAGIDGGGRLCILNSQCHDHDSNFGHITTTEPSMKLPAAAEDNINITFPNMIEGDLATRILLKKHVNNTQQEQATDYVPLQFYPGSVSRTNPNAAALVIKSKKLLEANAENGIEIDLR